jgi:hypothetical protein
MSWRRKLLCFLGWFCSVPIWQSRQGESNQGCGVRRAASFAFTSIFTNHCESRMLQAGNTTGPQQEVAENVRSTQRCRHRTRKPSNRPRERVTTHVCRDTATKLLDILAAIAAKATKLNCNQTENACDHHTYMVCFQNVGQKPIKRIQGFLTRRCQSLIAKSTALLLQK